MALKNHRDLKIIANETGAIIVLLSQLSRGVESRNDKRPMLSDMKEAGGIEVDASLAMLFIEMIIITKTKMMNSVSRLSNATLPKIKTVKQVLSNLNIINVRKGSRHDGYRI